MNRRFDDIRFVFRLGCLAERRHQPRILMVPHLFTSQSPSAASAADKEESVTGPQEDDVRDSIVRSSWFCRLDCGVRSRWRWPPSLLPDSNSVLMEWGHRARRLGRRSCSLGGYDRTYSKPDRKPWHCWPRAGPIWWSATGSGRVEIGAMARAGREMTARARPRSFTGSSEDRSPRALRGGSSDGTALTAASAEVSNRR